MRRLIIAMLLLAPSFAWAQVDRRSRDEPEMYVNADGACGTFDSLMFSRGGRYLVAGGDDKCVRVWEMRDGRLLTGDAMKVLRWPGWREQRGGVKVIALPNEEGDPRVFIGGYGMKNGMVVVSDRKTGQQVATSDRPKIALPPMPVMASAFVPGDKSIIFGSSDGGMYHWDFADRHVRFAEFPRLGEKDFNRPRMIHFTDKDTFLAVAQGGEVGYGQQKDGAWTMTIVGNVRGAFEKGLTAQMQPIPVNPFSVYRAAVSPDGNWMACSFQPNYLLMVPLQGGAALVKKVDFVVRSLSFDPKGRLAVAETRDNVQTDFRLDNNDVIKVYDTPADGKFEPSLTFNHAGRAEAMAFHPNGWLAVGGGDSSEVSIYDARPTAKKVDGPSQVVRGRGRSMWEVRVGADDKSFMYRTKRSAVSSDPNNRGAGDWYGFDIVKGDHRAKPGKPTDVRNEADGWKIQPDKKDPFVWNAVRADGTPPTPIALDPDRNEQPRCYCFIPKTATKPTRVLIGHYYGFSMFELVPGQPARLAMLATGHAGDVVSIATDAAGTWAITGSTDQTITGWSLADYASGGLGAKIAVNPAGKPIVQSVDDGSSAWEMGLSAGDEIVMMAQTFSLTKREVHYGLPGTYAGGKVKLDNATGKPEAAIKAMANPIPGIESYVAFKPKGLDVVRENLSTFRRRPLWRFFPAFDENNRCDDFIAWMWHSGHYVSGMEGDRLVGWQMNDFDSITGKEPTFFDAHQFQAVLRREVGEENPVLQLMQNRNLPAALKLAFGDNPRPNRFSEKEPVNLTLKVSSPEVVQGGVTVTVEVPQSRNADLRLERVELWLNDYIIETWKDDGASKSFTKQVTFKEGDFRAGENQFAVLAFKRDGGRSEATERIVNPRREPARPRVIGMSAGINDYSGSFKNKDGSRDFGDLTAATKDAEMLVSRWQEHVGPKRFYSDGKELIARLGPTATKQEILDQLRRISKEAKPNDRVVIFLAGHGDFVKLKPTDTRKSFVYCTPTYDRTKPEETGVTAQAIAEELARCRGRKVILMDACHSGEAASASIVRQLIPNGYGPVVLAACDQNEQSFEDPKRGNGLFTSAILEAMGPRLGDADASGDGQIDPRELFTYVRTRMPNLLQAAGKSPDAQNPLMFPRRVRNADADQVVRFPIGSK